MKKIILLITVLFSQYCEAEWITSFADAQKLALATNKLMIVDFWATWCGPCKKMDANSWSDKEVNSILEQFVTVKIDIDMNSDLALKYGINSIPNIFIMDGNGKVIYNFDGYHDANQLKNELEDYVLSTEYLSSDLINFYKMNNFNTAIRVAQRYFDYSLFVDSEIKPKLLNVTVSYLSEAKKALHKKDEDYIEKSQKLMFIELFQYAYALDFIKLNKKLKESVLLDIKESNINYYYFLKYITAKGLNNNDFIEMQEKAKRVEGFDYFESKANFILSKQEKN